MRQHWSVGGNDCSPEEDEGDDSVTTSSDRERANWMNDCQVAVERHQDECIDAGVSCHVNHVLVDLTTRTVHTQ